MCWCPTMFTWSTNHSVFSKVYVQIHSHSFTVTCTTITLLVQEVHLKVLYSFQSLTQFPASSVVRKVKILMNFRIPFLEVSVNMLYNFPCTTIFKLPNDSLRMRKHYMVRTVISSTFFGRRLVGHFLSTVLQHGTWLIQWAT